MGVETAELTVLFNKEISQQTDNKNNRSAIIENDQE